MSKIKGFCIESHPFPSGTSHFPFIPATILSHEFCRHGGEECRSHLDERVNPGRTLEYIADRPSRFTREGGPKSRNETAAEPSAMINWHAEDLMKYPGATVDPMSEPDVEAAWSTEIQRRLVEIEAGTVELIPWDDVRSELFDESNGENNGIRI